MYIKDKSCSSLRCRIKVILNSANSKLLFFDLRCFGLYSINLRARFYIYGTLKEPPRLQLS